MTKEKMQQAVETQSKPELSTRMAELFLDSINLIEQKVAAGDAEIALGYVEAFYLYQAFDKEEDENYPHENQISEFFETQTDISSI